MKKSIKTPYSSSEKTRKKILSAAQDLFAKKGFAAASISMIADKARINQSLIYHHFGNKEGLWKAIKSEFSKEMVGENNDLEADISDLNTFIQVIVISRLERYLDNPELVRIMGWQKMEKSRDQLAGGAPASPDRWKKTIEALQRKKEITSSLSSELIILLIVSLTSGAVSEDYEKVLQEPKARKKYISLMTDLLKQALVPK